MPVDGLVTPERRKDNVLGIACIICEGTGEGVEVVRPDGNERPLTTDVLMQFVLQIDERRIRRLREGDVTKHSRDDIRTNRGALNGKINLKDKNSEQQQQQ